MDWLPTFLVWNSTTKLKYESKAKKTNLILQNIGDKFFSRNTNTILSFFIDSFILFSNLIIARKKNDDDILKWLKQN